MLVALCHSTRVPTDEKRDRESELVQSPLMEAYHVCVFICCLLSALWSKWFVSWNDLHSLEGYLSGLLADIMQIVTTLPRTSRINRPYALSLLLPRVPACHPHPPGSSGQHYGDDGTPSSSRPQVGSMRSLARITSQPVLGYLHFPLLLNLQTRA